jgi:hypothetical protein
VLDSRGRAAQPAHTGAARGKAPIPAVSPGVGASFHGSVTTHTVGSYWWCKSTPRQTLHAGPRLRVRSYPKKGRMPCFRDSSVRVNATCTAVGTVPTRSCKDSICLISVINVAIVLSYRRVPATLPSHG